jgi:hypothetical protein
MGRTLVNDNDRVRANTKPQILRKIDNTIEEKIRYYAFQPKEVIAERIQALEREWDIERVLETNASSIALFSLLLGLTRGKKWFIVTSGVLGFLLMHAVEGWCPPVPLLRKFGVRTRSEIDREKFALKVLRGDFQSVEAIPDDIKKNPADDLIEAIKN